ncbi:hypothetical protein GCM10014713_49990 [Streptomyces purpureus]|uniref:Uncharacterized protein n=1 Tax=Streptomyces purpureus TaxID=1951 RepID=A0A918HAI1_9ACTN|nr:hypothetical protein GCM10014713_49990 [Streptomyces purpureus]
MHHRRQWDQAPQQPQGGGGRVVGVAGRVSEGAQEQEADPRRGEGDEQTPQQDQGVGTAG